MREWFLASRWNLGSGGYYPVPPAKVLGWDVLTTSALAAGHTAPSWCVLQREGRRKGLPVGCLCAESLCGCENHLQLYFDAVRILITDADQAQQLLSG